MQHIAGVTWSSSATDQLNYLQKTSEKEQVSRMWLCVSSTDDEHDDDDDDDHHHNHHHHNDDNDDEELPMVC